MIIAKFADQSCVTDKTIHPSKAHFSVVVAGRDSYGLPPY
jgi:hypothetical protein